MCVAMCGGVFALSFIFFGAAGLIGYPTLDHRYPELPILVAAVAMASAMAAWMAFRDHPVDHTLEMSGATLVVGILMSSAFWLGIFPERSLVAWPIAHVMLCGPACLAMVLVMLRHADHYTGEVHHPAPAA
jgi:hypothetical protein